MSAKEIDDSVIKFSADLYSKVIAKQGNVLENTFLSPLSIYTACVMTMAGAGKNTLLEMSGALHIPSSLRGDDVHTKIGPHLMKNLASTKDVEFSIANRLFALQNININTEYAQNLKKNYEAAVDNLNSLGNVDAKREHINNWVSDNTKGKIPELIASGGLDASVVLMLVNALYFKGAWKEQFPVCNTLTKSFKCLGGKSVRLPMMYVEEHFPFVNLNDLDAMALKLPFLGDKWKMLIILPNKQDGLKKLLDELSKPGRLASVLAHQFHAGTVSVQLPRFKLYKHESSDVKSLLEQCGIRSLFDSSADLSKMCSDKQLFVDSVQHKAVLEVDEEGATAAAATGMNIMPLCAVINPEFFVDHPFFLAIVSENNVPAFIGHVIEPEEN